MLVAVGIVAGVILLLFLLWYGAEVLLLLFASILVAIFLRSLSDGVSKYTPLSSGWSLAVVIPMLLGLFGLWLWLLAPNVVEQTRQMMQSLAEARDQLEQLLARYDGAQQILDQTPSLNDVISSQTNIFSRITGIFSTGLEMLTNFVIIIAVGFYLAVNPGLYVNGLVRLVPPDNRPRAREVLNALG